MTSFATLAHFNDYDPRDFGWKKRKPDLVPLSFGGVNFGSCARQAHGVFMALLGELVPHIPGGLHAGSCGAYSTTDDLPDGSWSFHRFGIAIDVNWNANVMGASNAPTGQYAIPHGLASRLARKYGLEYGGDWSNPKDWMHFEVHLTPTDAAQIQPTTDGGFTVDADAAKRFDAADKEIAALAGQVADLRKFLHDIYSVKGADGVAHQYGELTLDQVAAKAVTDALGPRLDAIEATLNTNGAITP